MRHIDLVIKTCITWFFPIKIEMSFSNFVTFYHAKQMNFYVPLSHVIQTRIILSCNVSIPILKIKSNIKYLDFEIRNSIVPFYGSENANYQLHELSIFKIFEMNKNIFWWNEDNLWHLCVKTQSCSKTFS